MEHKQIIYGEYVLTPCKNAFNEKTSYWLSKKNHTISVYAFTPMDARDLKEMTTDESMQAYINHFEDKVGAKTKSEITSMLQQMQKETAKCVGFIAGTVSQLWVIRELLGTRIEEFGGESIEIRIE